MQRKGKKKVEYRIRRRILMACVSLVVAGLTLVGALIQSIYKEAQISSTEANGRVIVEQIANNISVRAGEYADIVLREVQTVKLFEKYINNPVSEDYFNRRIVAGIVNQHNTSRSKILDFYVRSAGGEWIYFNYGTQSLRGASPAVTDYVEEHWADIPRGALWKCFEEEPGTVYMMRTIFGTAHLRDEGIVVIGIDKSVFETQFKALEESTQAKILILNAGGEVLFGDRANIPLEALLAGGQPGAEPLIRAEGGQYLVCQGKTQDGVWRVAYIVGENALFVPIRRMQSTIAMVCLLTIVGAFLLAATISRGLTASIRGLCAYIQRLQTGDWNAPVPAFRDEMGLVAEAFDEMALHLHDTVENLAQQKLETEQAEYRAMQAEYHALQAAINPHFIFNAMDSINAAAKLEGQNGIASICTALGRLMRVAISRQKNTVTLREELNYIRDYLKVQRFMMGDRLEVEFDLEPTANLCRVPSLLLQPLVENAVVHGIEDMEEGAVIYITTEVCTHEQGRPELLVYISDNGVGMDRQTLKKYSDFTKTEEDGHFGIISVQKRINILYGEQYGVTISSDKGRGTVVCVRLPFEAQPQEGVKG